MSHDLMTNYDACPTSSDHSIRTMAVTMSVLLTVVLAGVGCVFGQAPGAIPQGVTVPVCV